MVDPVGPKGSTPSDLRVAPVAPVAAVAKAIPVAGPLSPVGRLATDLSAQPPVDTDRVQRIKRAIAAGNFPILPATVADRLMALRYDWISDDAA